VKYAIIGIFCSSVLAAQTPHTFVQRENGLAIVAGMGINLVNASGIVEYINANAVPNQRVDDFTTAVDFFGGVEFPVSEEWGLKIEHTYLLKSYTFHEFSGETQELFYATQSPSLMVQKVIVGEGYFVKMGAGGGYHFGHVSQKFSRFGTSADFTSSGFGMKMEIVGQTSFDEHFYGYIGGHVGWEFQGKFSQSGNAVSSFQSYHFNYFFAGLRFGVTYYL
jgi:hypothetical protein